MASYLDPKFRYHGHASHVDSRRFWRRQQQRLREAEAARPKDPVAKPVVLEVDTVAIAAERAAKVRPIHRKRRTA